MFETFKIARKLNAMMKSGDTAVISKSERQMNISDTGRALEMLKLADYEDTGTTRTVKDPLAVHDWVNIAVNFRAQNIARTRFTLMRGDTEVENHEAQKVFDRPNPYMAGFQLWEATESWLCVRGEALWVFPGLTGGATPEQIWVVDPSMYEHKLSPAENKKPQQIVLWLYKDDKHPEGIPFRPYEVVHFKKWNKWNFWRGVAPLYAHRENIEQDVNANISNTNLIKNKSVPPGILSSDQVLSDAAADELVKRWEEKHKGAAKAYKIAVLGRNAKYQPIGLTPDDMNYDQMKKWNRTSILARFGLTAGVFGYRDDSSPLSGTDTQEQLKMAWTLTLIPELNFLESVLKVEYFDRFGLDVEGEFDTDVIPELQTDKEKEEMRLRENIKVGLYTINEAREEIEKDPVDWGDVYWRPFNLEAEDGSEKEEPPPQPGPFGQPPGQIPQAPPKPGQPPKPVKPPASNTPAPPKQEKVQRWLIGYLMESTRRWESLTSKYRKEIDTWFFRQRAWYLDRYTKAYSPSVTKTYEEFVFWAEQIEMLKKFSRSYFLKGVELAGQDLVTIMRQTGFSTEFDIYQVNIGAVVDSRLNLLPKIGDNMQKSLGDLIKEGTQQGLSKEQLADAIRDRFKDIEGKANTIAETELGAIKSEAQHLAYQAEGVQRIQWIHNPAMSKEPREGHAELDGETVMFMVETFVNPLTGNSLYYPRDPGGGPEEVINCHCDYIPLREE